MPNVTIELAIFTALFGCHLANLVGTKNKPSYEL